MAANTAARPESRLRSIVTLLLAFAILLPSLWGFGTKFYEFVLLARGDVEGIFAVTPVINYLLASLGFLCLFGWAGANGMFHDIEQPKRTMLEIEQQLDASETSSTTSNEAEKP
jgi:hypothetical protein